MPDVGRARLVAKLTAGLLPKTFSSRFEESKKQLKSIRSRQEGAFVLGAGWGLGPDG